VWLFTTVALSGFSCIKGLLLGKSPYKQSRRNLQESGRYEHDGKDAPATQPSQLIQLVIHNSNVLPPNKRQAHAPDALPPPHVLVAHMLALDMQLSQPVQAEKIAARRPSLGEQMLGLAAECSTAVARRRWRQTRRRQPLLQGKCYVLSKAERLPKMFYSTCICTIQWYTILFC
jgi:hypothetical protein